MAPRQAGSKGTLKGPEQSVTRGRRMDHPRPEGLEAMPCETVSGRCRRPGWVFWDLPVSVRAACSSERGVHRLLLVRRRPGVLSADRAGSREPGRHVTFRVRKSDRRM